MTYCCTLLLYGPTREIEYDCREALTWDWCGPPGTRTPNLWIKSPQLCH